VVAFTDTMGRTTSRVLGRTTSRKAESSEYKADVTTLKRFVQNAAVSTIHQDNRTLRADQFAHACHTRGNKRRCPGTPAGLTRIACCLH
jgi:hypothetical protein